MKIPAQIRQRCVDDTYADALIDITRDSVDNIINSFVIHLLSAISEEEAIDGIAEALWNTTPSHCDVTWQQAKRLKEADKRAYLSAWVKVVDDHIGAAKAAYQSLKIIKTLKGE